MANSNRYKKIINDKEYESTLNILGNVVVREYKSFAPEFGKGVHVDVNSGVSNNGNHRYKKVINGKEYESTLNILGNYVPKYCGAELGKGVQVKISESSSSSDENKMAEQAKEEETMQK